MLSTTSFLFFTSLAVSAVASNLAARSAFSPLSDLHRRGLTGQNVAFACFGGGGDCECPLDNNGDSGVLINVYPGFQCAFPSGACTWDDKVSKRADYVFISSCMDINFHFYVDHRLALCPISIKLIAPRLLPAAPLAVVAAPGTSTATPAFLSISSLVTNAHTRTVLALGTL